MKVFAGRGQGRRVERYQGKVTRKAKKLRGQVGWDTVMG